MKRIVAYLMPAGSSVPSPAGGDEEYLDSLHSGVDRTSPGAVKIELLVADGEAQAIFDMLLQPDPSECSDSVIDELLRRAIELAGKDADNLFEKVMSRIEKKLVMQVYDACQGVQTRTAARLGINRNTLYSKLRQYQPVQE